MFTEEINAPAGSYNSLTHQVAYCKMQGECLSGEGEEGGREGGADGGEGSNCAERYTDRQCILCVLA